MRALQGIYSLYAAKAFQNAFAAVNKRGVFDERKPFKSRAFNPMDRAFWRYLLLKGKVFVYFW